MDRDEFWKIVETARAAAGETVTGEAANEVARHLTAQLASLGPAAAVDFKLAYEVVTDEAYRWDLWAAAYLMRGGCSDDSFDYFRGWLVAQGRNTWERALANPDSLADLGVDPEDDGIECEDVLAAPYSAYAEVTGDKHAFWAALDAADTGPRRVVGSPAGDNFDFDDDNEMRARLPRLAAIYCPAD